MIVRDMIKNANPMQGGAIENVRKLAKEIAKNDVKKENPAQRLTTDEKKGRTIDTSA